MLRGGSWNNNQNNARCANRNRNNPNNSNNNIGFRLISHDFPLPGRQCHGSQQTRAEAIKKNGVTCPRPARYNACRANTQRPGRLW